MLWQPVLFTLFSSSNHDETMYSRNVKIWQWIVVKKMEETLRCFPKWRKIQLHSFKRDQRFLRLDDLRQLTAGWSHELQTTWFCCTLVANNKISKGKRGPLPKVYVCFWPNGQYDILFTLSYIVFFSRECCKAYWQEQDEVPPRNKKYKGLHYSTFNSWSVKHTKSLKVK